VVLRLCSMTWLWPGEGFARQLPAFACLIFIVFCLTSILMTAADTPHQNIAHRVTVVAGALFMRSQTATNRLYDSIFC
jgi:hypothetical protein